MTNFIGRSKCSWCLIHTAVVLSIRICYNFSHCFMRSIVWLSYSFTATYFTRFQPSPFNNCNNNNILNQAVHFFAMLARKQYYSCVLIQMLFLILATASSSIRPNFFIHVVRERNCLFWILIILFLIIGPPLKTHLSL